MSDDCVVLSTGSQFSCEAISQRFGPQLKETWGLVIRPVRKLSIVARQQMREDARRVEALKGTLAAASPLRAKAEASALKGAERRSSGIDDLYSPVDERATFETCAVDETNEMAFAAARQIFAPGANGPKLIGFPRLRRRPHGAHTDAAAGQINGGKKRRSWPPRLQHGHITLIGERPLRRTERNESC